VTLKKTCLLENDAYIVKHFWFFRTILNINHNTLTETRLKNIGKKNYIKPCCRKQIILKKYKNVKSISQQILIIYLIHH